VPDRTLSQNPEYSESSKESDQSSHALTVSQTMRNLVALTGYYRVSLANNVNGESFNNIDVPMLPMVAYGAYPHVAVGIGTSLGECPILAIGIGRNRQTYSIVGEFMGVMGDQAMSMYSWHE
jgi:hypothetical protein